VEKLAAAGNTEEAIGIRNHINPNLQELTCQLASPLVLVSRLLFPKKMERTAFQLPITHPAYTAIKGIS